VREIRNEIDRHVRELVNELNQQARQVAGRATCVRPPQHQQSKTEALRAQKCLQSGTRSRSDPLLTGNSAQTTRIAHLRGF
jgi:hypothetical protein